MGSNHRPSGYEPDELPLLYFAIWVANIQSLHISSKLILIFFPDGTAATCIYTFDNTRSFIIYYTATACIGTQFLVDIHIDNGATGCVSTAGFQGRIKTIKNSAAACIHRSTGKTALQIGNT